MAGGARVFTDENVAKMRARLVEGASYRDVAKEFGTTEGSMKVSFASRGISLKTIREEVRSATADRARSVPGAQQPVEAPPPQAPRPRVLPPAPDAVEATVAPPWDGEVDEEVRVFCSVWGKTAAALKRRGEAQGLSLHVYASKILDLVARKNLFGTIDKT